jgi:hypothetical protein
MSGLFGSCLGGWCGAEPLKSGVEVSFAHALIDAEGGRLLTA